MIEKVIKHKHHSYYLGLKEPEKETDEEKKVIKKNKYFTLYINRVNHNHKLGKNFNLRKEKIDKERIPIFKSESKKALEYVYNMINEDNIDMFYLINNTHAIDDIVINLDYDKYNDLLPDYSQFMVFMEYVTGRDDVYSYLVNNLSSVFFQSDLYPEINTLSIITRFIDYNFPQEEIVYLFKKAVTLHNQIELDNMLDSHMIKAFSHVNPEEFNTLEQWEKTLFYHYCGFFANIEDKTFSLNDLPLSFLPGIFVTALYDLKKQNKSILPIVNEIRNVDAHINDFASILEYIVENTTVHASPEQIDDEVKNLFYYLSQENVHNINHDYSYAVISKSRLIRILTLYVSLFYTKEENNALGITLMINVWG